ncbi:hypothetical protein [Seonamhaeicola sp.]|uniref:hypothetical protein n=1 Tax=Seonamhaeicola sp. TaxID=1912245 RepID=UPI00262E30D3|nr:hypothetical protein [Seonamhaeicola sp.]
MAKRNLINEILEIKNRNKYNSSLNLLAKIQEVNLTLNHISGLEPNKKKDLIKYIPVSIVACFQSYFREIITELIDSGEPYSTNAIKLNQLNNIKFNLEILNALKKKKFSIGEFVAHLLPCNNLSDFNSGLSIITQTDFLQELKESEIAIKKNDISSKNNLSSVIQSINKVFELRHILSHEYAFETNISEKEANKIFNNCVIFLSFVLNYFSIKNNPIVDKTDEEVLEDIKREYQSVSKELEELVNDIILQKSEGKFSKFFDENLFRESIQKWKSYVTAKIDVEYGFLRITRLKFVYNSIMVTETKKKVTELKEFYEKTIINNSEKETKDNTIRDEVLKEIITNMLTD